MTLEQKQTSEVKLANKFERQVRHSVNNTFIWQKKNSGSKIGCLKIKKGALNLQQDQLKKKWMSG